MSEPPPASSWAAPPEFYIDENTTGRTLRKRFERYGYVVHTPAELFGSLAQARGRADEEWLARVAAHGWAVIGRDTKILERPGELAAYERSGLHMFLFPGQATVQQLVDLVDIHLRDICTATTDRVPQVHKVTATGLDLLRRKARRRRRSPPP